MIIAESIGFAATHTFAEILGGLPGFDVSHGSQHFETKGALGQGQQTPEDFVASMAAAQQAGQRPVALHTLFSPQLLKPACEAAGGRYWLLVRSPEAQIDSCYAWIGKKVLNGDAPSFVQVLNQVLGPLNKMQIPASLPNALYLYAVNHVLSFNFFAVGLGAPAFKMEELLNDEAAFRAAFDVPADLAIPHFAGSPVHGPSHRGQKETDVLGAPDRDTIRERYSLSLGDRNYGLADMKMLLRY